MTLRRNQAGSWWVVAIIVGMRDMTDRLVENDGDASGLLQFGTFGKAHRLAWQGAAAKLGDRLTIEQNQALLNIEIGFAARADATLSQQLGDANTSVVRFLGIR